MWLSSLVNLDRPRNFCGLRVPLLNKLFYTYFTELGEMLYFL